MLKIDVLIHMIIRSGPLHTQSYYPVNENIQLTFEGVTDSSSIGFP